MKFKSGELKPVDSNITTCISYLKRQLNEIELEETGMFFVCKFHTDFDTMDTYLAHQSTRKVLIRQMLKQLENKANAM